MLLSLLAGLYLADSPQLCADRVTVVSATQPCPSYVFFDSGKTEIRREWEPVLDAAAAAAKGGATLLLSGHSDTPGDASGNLRLSRERANAVAAALVARGVPRSALSMEAAGEQRLLVPTAEGVREVQNRRVTITIRP
jgi:outer membrane protein OmpA-like peptidoglycan-associated protein